MQIVCQILSSRQICPARGYGYAALVGKVLKEKGYEYQLCSVAARQNLAR